MVKEENTPGSQPVAKENNKNIGIDAITNKIISANLSFLLKRILCSFMP